MSHALAAGTILVPWRHHVLPEEARAWSEILRDPNPIHLDPTAVVRLGLGVRAINQGPANLSYLYSMLAFSLPAGRVLTLDARLTGPIWVGEVVEVSGSVASVSEDAAGSTARCRLILRGLPDRPPAVLADADVRFEARSAS